MNYSELRRTMRRAVYVSITMTIIAIYAIACMLSTKADNAFMAGRLKSADVINLSQAVTIDELRAQQEAKEVVFQSSLPALPGINGMECPKK